MTRSRSAVLAAGVLATATTVGGCSGSSSGGSPAPGPGLVRGTQLPSFSCDAAGDAADGAGSTASIDVKAAPADVLSTRICPLNQPEPFNRPPAPVTLVRGSPHFQALVTALSLADAERDPMQACPEYAELRAPIIGRTASSAFLVHYPADSCGHTLPAVSRVLSDILA
jgi:hypothetical protein